VTCFSGQAVWAWAAKPSASAHAARILFMGCLLLDREEKSC
jgi:hypothetical protein